MTEHSAIHLIDGRQLQASLWTYPIESARQQRLIQLLRTEWRQTDFDWLQAMGGDFSDHLTIRAVIASIDGVDAGTASIYYANDNPEIALLGNVLTHRDFRRLQIARKVTEVCVEAAFAAGCRVVYLGTTPSPRCVYLSCGFQWVSGGVMRRSAPGDGEVEAEVFAAGQPTVIREAHWGDLPSVALFAAQPSDTLVIDYSRGLFSSRFVPLARCVSNFPAIWCDVAAHGGAMCVLNGSESDRVLAIGSLTPGAGRAGRHRAVLEVAAHDNYRDQCAQVLEWLSARAMKLDVRVLQAYVASQDKCKAEMLRKAGFRAVAELDRQLCIDDRLMSVQIFQRESDA